MKCDWCDGEVAKYQLWSVELQEWRPICHKCLDCWNFSEDGPCNECGSLVSTEYIAIAPSIDEWRAVCKTCAAIISLARTDREHGRIHRVKRI